MWLHHGALRELRPLVLAVNAANHAIQPLHVVCRISTGKPAQRRVPVCDVHERVAVGGTPQSRRHKPARDERSHTHAPVEWHCFRTAQRVVVSSIAGCRAAII